MRRLLLITIACLLAACTIQPPPGITPVTGFDVQRYSGKWYEILRLDNRFERDLSDVSATYTLRANGDVGVLNRGYNTTTGRWDQADGHAKFNGDPRIASLKVSFFDPFYGGYHVVALDPDYRWAMVAGNDRSYLWILARDKQLPAEVIDTLRKQAGQLGFDTSRLIQVGHTRSDG
ncbi:lipocalin family protein [Burkholderiaceae bacterium DAT-1]|nr:lipocalin family protein [Burkholderiaceae bacterium DAT-1]